MKLFLLSAMVALANAIPVDPSSEVELVEPVNTNEEEPEIGGFPILVITTRNRRPTFGGFPFLSPSSFFGNDDRFAPFLPVSHEDEDELPEISAENLFPGGFGSIFGSSDEGQCGLLCRIFKSLNVHIKELEKEVKEVRDRQNEIDGDSSVDSDEGPKTVYEEKVLDDGRVLKINKTTYTDTSDDGSSFFAFSSTKVISNAKEDASDDKDSNDDESDDKEVIDDSRDVPTEEIEEAEKENVERVRRFRAASDQQQQQLGATQFDQQQWDNVEFGEKPSKNLYKKWKPIKKHPTYSLPIDMKSDTRVNEIMTENEASGGLSFMDPDSEFIKRETK